MFKKLQRNARKAIDSKYTPKSAKEALAKSVVNNCSACVLIGKYHKAKHRVGKARLCDAHYEEMKLRAEEKNNDKNDE